MKASWKSLVTCAPALAALADAQNIVDDQALQDAITIDGLFAHAQALEDIAYATPGRNRRVASVGHNNTIQYIVDQLEALGGYYDVELQPFDEVLQLSSFASLVANAVNYSVSALAWSPSASLVDTPIVPVANLGCSASDYPSAVASSIALIERGVCAFADKAYYAKAAGAAAALIYNNADGVFSGTLGGQNDTLAPAAGLSRADGLALLALAAGNSTTTGPVAAALEIVTDVGPAYSSNVIATTTYATNSTDVLVLGAHSDGVEAGPGVNDNGSGTAGLLEVAIQLARGNYTGLPTVRFAWWTAEEEGLLGAEAYVATLAETAPEELERVRLYLNFDMIASNNYVFGVYDGDASDTPAEEGVAGPAGSGQAEAVFADWFDAQGYNSTPDALDGRSDYGPFLVAGIPVGGLTTGADKVKTEEQVAQYGGTAGIQLDTNYHTPYDNTTNLAKEAFEVMGKGIAHAVAYYGANGFAGFPAKSSSASFAPEGQAQTQPLKPYTGYRSVV